MRFYQILLALASAACCVMSCSSVTKSSPSENLSPAQLRDWIDTHAPGETRVDLSLDLRSLAIASDQKTMYSSGNFYRTPTGASGTGGVVTSAILRSPDGGLTWVRMPVDLPLQSVNQIQILGDGEILAFAILESEGGLFEGVLASPDDGATWTFHSWNRSPEVENEIQKTIGCCSEQLIFAQFSDREKGALVLQGNEKIIRLQTTDGGHDFTVSPTKIFMPIPRSPYLFKVLDSENGAPEKVDKRKIRPQSKEALKPLPAHAVEIWKVDGEGHPTNRLASVPERWTLQVETLEIQPTP